MRPCDDTTAMCPSGADPTLLQLSRLVIPHSLLTLLLSILVPISGPLPAPSTHGGD